MTKEESDLIITEQNKNTEEILKAVAKVKSDYHELCKLKDMHIAELEAQIEKMKRCSICKYSSDLGYCKIRCNGGECNKMDKWELAD